MKTDQERKQELIDRYGVNLSHLNIDNVRKWVKALRSGKYKKTVGNLYQNGSYCALGVAEKISTNNKSHLEQAGSLSSRAMEWLGVEAPNPRVGRTSIVTRNDTRGQSFQTIAAAIEKFWIKPWEKYKHCFPVKK